MSDTQNNTTILNINRRVQNIWWQHEKTRIETAGYEDTIGDDVRHLMDRDDNT